MEPFRMALPMKLSGTYLTSESPSKNTAVQATPLTMAASPPNRMRIEDAIVATLPCLTLPLQTYDAAQHSAKRSASSKGLFTGVRGRGILGSSRTWSVRFVLRKRTGERSVQFLLDGMLRGTKAVMTRVELGGTLFLVAVIGVLLTSRGEKDESS